MLDAGTPTVLLLLLLGVIVSLVACIYGTVLRRIGRLEKKVNAIMRALLFLVSNQPAAENQNPGNQRALQALTDAMKDG